MPLIPEEPQIHESAQGSSTAPANGRSTPTPRPVPGPRPGRPGPARPKPPAQRTAAVPVQPSPPAPGRAASGARPGPGGRAGSAGLQPAKADAAAGQPQIQLVPAQADGALDAAEEAVDLLLESGRAPGDVLVLSTGELHPWATHELSFGELSYWAQHDAADDVFYAAAADVERAASRPVVVVAVNGGSDETAATALPLALSRAGALLIVCGDPERINAALGAGV